MIVERKQFVLTLEDIDPDAIVPTEARLRGVLKRLLRTHKFICVSIRPLPSAQNPLLKAIDAPVGNFPT